MKTLDQLTPEQRANDELMIDLAYQYAESLKQMMTSGKVDFDAAPKNYVYEDYYGCRVNLKRIDFGLTQDIESGRIRPIGTPVYNHRELITLYMNKVQVVNFEYKYLNYLWAVSMIEILDGITPEKMAENGIHLDYLTLKNCFLGRLDNLKYSSNPSSLIPIIEALLHEKENLDLDSLTKSLSALRYGEKVSDEYIPPPPKIQRVNGVNNLASLLEQNVGVS